MSFRINVFIMKIYSKFIYYEIALKRNLIKLLRRRRCYVSPSLNLNTFLVTNKIAAYTKPSVVKLVMAIGEQTSLLHTLILRTNEKLELIPHDLVLF